MPPSCNRFPRNRNNRSQPQVLALSSQDAMPKCRDLPEIYNQLPCERKDVA